MTANTAADTSAKPRPTPDADSAAYWRGLSEGKLLLQHCKACPEVQVYHQAICRRCGGANFDLREASGKATVYSYSVVHRAPGPAFKDDVPYAVLLVELAEGPRMISSLVGADPDSTEIGMAVTLVCDRVDDTLTLPRFRPAALARG